MEVQKLEVGGGHSTILIDAFFLKELCEFRLIDIVTIVNTSKIEDVSLRVGSDTLACLCEILKKHQWWLFWIWREQNISLQTHLSFKLCTSLVGIA